MVLQPEPTPAKGTYMTNATTAAVERDAALFIEALETRGPIVRGAAS